MPLYEYKCKKCGHRFELIQSFSAEDPKGCPVCQSEVERLISTPARAHFKGSGFYSTDYGAKPAAPGQSADSAKGSGGETSAASADKGGSADKNSAAKVESTASPAPSSPAGKSE